MIVGIRPLSRPATAIAVAAPSVAIITAGAVGGSILGGHLAAIGLALAVFIAVVVTLRHQPVALLASLTVWLSIERFALAALSPGLSPDALRLALGYKETFFPLVGIAFLPHALDRWRAAPSAVRAVDCLAITFGAVVVVAGLLSNAPLDDRLVYARRFVVLPLVYLAFRLMPWHDVDLRRPTLVLVAAGVALAGFGLVERFLLESAIWRNLVPASYYYHLSNLAGLVASGADFPVNGLPINFYDFTTEVPNRRLVSTFLEATTLGSFLALAAILAVAKPTMRSLPVAAFLGIAGVLTLSKAAIVILAGSIVYLAVTTAIPRLRHPVWLMSLLATLIAGLVVVALALEFAGSTTGALTHFDGLRDGLRIALTHPFGVGLGRVGTFGDVLTAGDSMFGVLLAQLGFVGFLLWACWFVQLAIASLVVGRRAEPARLGAAVAIALTAFFATASLTESAGGLLGNWAYAAVAGILLTGARNG